MPHYRLDWKEGHGLQTDPDPLYFEAHNDNSALQRVAKASGAELYEDNELTRDAFLKAGVSAVFEGNRKVFPI